MFSRLSNQTDKVFFLLLLLRTDNVLGLHKTKQSVCCKTEYLVAHPLLYKGKVCDKVHLSSATINLKCSYNMWDIHLTL